MKVISINAHGKFSTGNIATTLTKAAGEGSRVLYTRDLLETSVGTKFYSKMGFFLDLFLTRLTGRDSVWSRKNTGKIIKKIKEEKPDVVHLHNLHGFYLDYRKLFSFLKKQKIKVVWTLHDAWAFTGHCAHFDFIGCEKWQTQCKNCPQKKKTYLKSWLLDGSKYNFKAKKKAFSGLSDLTIVTPSQWLASLVKQSFLKEYPVLTIHNGVSTELFDPKKTDDIIPGLPEGKKIVLAVASSWDEMKGLGDVITLSRSLPAEYQVVMVGLTPQQKEKIGEENIFSICRTDNREQLATLYALSYVFINTTYQDTFPTVNLEALCSGTPVITYATGGCTETVDTTCGVTVKKGDVDAMLSEILSLEEKSFDREAISRKAKEKFSKEKMISSYLTLYETKTTKD